MTDGGPPDRLGLEIRVGDLVGHADRQREIREVGEVGWIVLVEVDSAGDVPRSRARHSEGRRPCGRRPTRGVMLAMLSETRSPCSRPVLLFAWTRTRPTASRLTTLALTRIPSVVLRPGSSLRERSGRLRGAQRPDREPHPGDEDQGRDRPGGERDDPDRGEHARHDGGQQADTGGHPHPRRWPTGRRDRSSSEAGGEWGIAAKVREASSFASCRLPNTPPTELTP